MNKKEIKELIRALRKEATILWKKYYNVYISVNLKAITGEIMEVNPYCLDLRSGKYFGRDLIDGEYKTVRFW